MFVTPRSISTFKGYIPLSEYKGPILKLTKKDKELIAHYIHEKSIIELEIMQLRSVCGNYKVPNVGSDWYEDKMGSLVKQRDDLNNLINEVKRNRLNKQKLSDSKKQ